MTDKEKATDWFFNGERGLSSETICRAFLGQIDNRGWGPYLPGDADDFARCRLFLESLSADGVKEALTAVAARHSEWLPLVRDWAMVCETMDRETPEWRTDRRQRWSEAVYIMTGRLAVEGYRLKYPKARIETNKNGTLSVLDTTCEVTA